MLAEVETLHDIERLLRVAANCMQSCIAERGEQATDSARAAAWRVADAALLLKRTLDHEGIKGIGIDSPTGRGAVLMQPHSA